jgi:type I restriction enzyme M protein
LDFAAKRAAAVQAATPHWQRAEAERSAALALAKPLRTLEQDIAAMANTSQKAKLQDRQRTVKAEQQAHEQAAKAAQAEGDALYWPIYNLDLKNPHAKAGLLHANPKDLISAMRGHENEVMRLLGEIEALVSEVPT